MAITIENANDARCPLIHHLEYKEYLTEIVYKFEKDYNQFVESHYELVNHDLYRLAQSKNYLSFSAFNKPGFEKHAYGLLVEPIHTKVLVMDFDEQDLAPLEFMKNLLMKQENVQVIDIIISSFDVNGKPKARHLYAGLSNPCNLISFYDSEIVGTCQGFCNLIVKNRELVIRVSQKFVDGKPVPGTEMQWEEGYTRIGTDKWLRFTSEQLIAPLISADVLFSDMMKRKQSRALRLRG